MGPSVCCLCKAHLAVDVAALSERLAGESVFRRCADCAEVRFERGVGRRLDCKSHTGTRRRFRDRSELSCLSVQLQWYFGRL